MQFTAWLASQFAQETKHSRRATDSTQHSQHHTIPQAPSVPLSADFHFAALLLQPLLNVMQASGTITAAASQASDVERQHPQSDAAQPSTDRRHSSKAQKRGKRGTAQSQVTSTVPLQWSTAAHGAAILVGGRLFLDWALLCCLSSCSLRLTCTIGLDIV